VTVVSTITTQPPMVADELRRQTDLFLDLAGLRAKIGRDPSERPARELREPQQHAPQQHTPGVPAARSATPRPAAAGDDFEH